MSEPDMHELIEVYAAAGDPWMDPDERAEARIEAVLSASAESTSATLARVERERDELAQIRERLSSRLTESAVRLAAYRQGRDLARAELASAQQELDALRTVRDQLGRDVTMAHATIRALKDLFRSGKYSDELCPRCGIEHQLEARR